MPVVSNTSPILNLALIDHIHLLPQQFEEVIIPPQVLAELKPTSAQPGARLIQQALDDRWLRPAELSHIHLAQALMLKLDRGEAAAIALAMQLGHNRILMDERDGRARAKALGLEPTGILGVLLRAKFEGQIFSIRTVMQALKDKAGFFIAADLFNTVLREAGET